MPHHHIPSYTSRATGAHGIYHTIHPLLQNDIHCLSHISPDKDLSHHDSNHWGFNKNFTTRFHFTGHREEAVVHLFGETLGADDGTGLGALGGTIKKPGIVLPSPTFSIMLPNTFEIQVISDNTVVRDVIVLDLPTTATTEIADLYNRQIQTLKNLFTRNLGVGNYLSVTPAYSNSTF